MKSRFGWFWEYMYLQDFTCSDKRNQIWQFDPKKQGEPRVRAQKYLQMSGYLTWYDHVEVSQQCTIAVIYSTGVYCKPRPSSERGKIKSIVDWELDLALIDLGLPNLEMLKIWASTVTQSKWTLKHHVELLHIWLLLMVEIAWKVSRGCEGKGEKEWDGKQTYWLQYSCKPTWTIPLMWKSQFLELHSHVSKPWPVDW